VSPPSRLRQLAERLGIISEYLDQTGRQVRRTTDATREALLSVMGFDAPTEDAAAGWLAELDHEASETLVDPVRVVRRDDKSARQVRIRLPPGMRTADVDLILTEEGGHVWKVRKKVAGGRAAKIELPTRVPYGYHRITVRLESRAGEGARAEEQSFIVVPSSCVTPEMLLGKREPRAMGVIANLYSLRREHDWGVGDFSTLTQLVEWSAARGAQFVGVNPLHALFNRGWDVSPYSPVSRLFRNPLYIDVDNVPEVAESEEARAILNAPESRATLRALRESAWVDYEGAIALKLRVLTEAHRAFRARQRGQRQVAYEDYLRQQDPEISRFAMWMALAESSGVADWRRWPAALQSPDDPAVRAFAAANAERVDFHKWLQFECDRQVHLVAQRARTLGMRIGAYQDLAIGTNPGGSDPWSYPNLFLNGATVGAPPDPYAMEGQNWGLPPMSPRALRAQRHRYWIQLLRRAFQHAGALRIDHVMGLFRAFWIPEGLSGKEGAYVRFPSEDLLGILALESVRHDALVVGEDLGTVPKEVPPALKRWGILSSKVLYFERDGRGRGFKPARAYPSLSLATANTHDMPTLAGFWTELDVEIRQRVGLLRTDAEVRGANRERARDKKALLARLGLSLPRHYEEATFPRRLAGRVHDFLCSTPAQLVGLSLDDLTGEVDPVNVPGVGPDKYPSWRRRTRMTMEHIAWSFEVDDAVRCDDRRGKGETR
jgi:4-alpha-glucanotransferase